MNATTPISISQGMAQLLQQLHELTLPANATEAQVQVHRAQVDRLSVLIGGMRMLSQQLAAEKAKQDADERALAQRLPHPAEVLCHLAARMPADFSVDQLLQRYNTYAAAVDKVLPPEDPPAPAAPQPAPAPTPAPAPSLPPPPAAPSLLPNPMPPLEPRPPGGLTYSLAWYLDQVTPELRRLDWQTLNPSAAQQHWLMYGRPEGRKWRPDAPAPFWGPREEDRPPEANPQ